MNHTTLLVGILLTLGIPLAATLASTFSAYGQQLSSPSSPSASSPGTTTISAKLKADLCNPSNPGLKVVNTTEARICNIPKTVKNTTTSSSSPSSPTTTSTSVASPSTTPSVGSATQVSSKVNPKQQVAITNNSNVPLRTNSATISAPYDTTSNVDNKPIPSSSSSPTTTIAPQVGVVSQGNAIHPQQSPPPIIATVSNGTNGQHSTPVSVSPLPGSDKLVYLGYNTGTGAGTGTDLTGKSTANTKSSTGKHDNDSTDKGNGSTKPSHTNDSGKSKPSHTNDSGKSKPSSKSKDHEDSGSNKTKKSSSKGGKSHKGGDSFFGHDPFF